MELPAPWLAVLVVSVFAVNAFRWVRSIRAGHVRFWPGVIAVAWKLACTAFVVALVMTPAGNSEPPSLADAATPLILVVLFVAGAAAASAPEIVVSWGRRAGDAGQVSCPECGAGSSSSAHLCYNCGRRIGS